MEVTLVDRLESNHGKIIDVSELEDREYDLKLRGFIGRIGGHVHNINLKKLKEFVSNLQYVGTVYVVPSQEINYGESKTV